MDAQAGLADFRGSSRPELLCWLQTILERNVWQLNQKHLSPNRDVRRELWVDEQATGLSFAWTSNHQTLGGPASKLITGESAMIVAAALAQLPTDYREAIELRFLEGMKLREIPLKQQTTIGRVAGLLRRGLCMLQDHLPHETRSELKGL